MKYDPERHHRRSIRLKGYDYSQADAYHVTIVAQHRSCLFGTVVSAEMHLNDAGRMLEAQWECLPERFPNVELDEYVVMPNHFHGILVLTGKRATTRVAPTDGGGTDGVGTDGGGTDGGGTDGIGTDGGGTDDGATGDGGRATTRVAPTDGGGTDGGATGDGGRATTRVAPTDGGGTDGGATGDGGRATTRVAPTDGGGTDGIGTDGGGTDDGATGDGGRATTRVAPTDGGGTDGGANVHDPILGDIVGAWKSISTDEYIVGVHRRNWEPFFRKLWQRNYWEHIVRDDADLARIRAYIVNNPANWESDEHNPKNARDPKGRRL